MRLRENPPTHVNGLPGGGQGGDHGAGRGPELWGLMYSALWLNTVMLAALIALGNPDSHGAVA